MDYHETANNEPDDIFEVRPASEWLNEVKEFPKMLLGDLWLEGEISVFFGESGAGKSLLAAQIGDAIARGRALEPFEMTAEAQKVLYIDLAQSGTQFARRFSTENGKPKASKLSPNLIRVALKHAIHVAPAKLGPLVERTGARVLIIDNLAFMQRYSLPRETAMVMRELRRLRQRYSLSILVLMNTSRAMQRRGIVAADIPGSVAVTSFADNIFAIGRSGSRSAVRYVKHIKHGSDDIAYGAAHVPYFEIKRNGGGFPTFCHLGYAGEMSVRAHDNDHHEWERIREIQRLSKEEKMTIRQIAEGLNMSRSVVHRLLQMAKDAPPLPEGPSLTKPAPVEFYGCEACIVARCPGCGYCKGRAANDYGSVGTNIYGHEDCPDDCDLCGPLRHSASECDGHADLKKASDDHYEALRGWLLAGKTYPRPVYPGARRYGTARACWQPGSETWPDELVDQFRRICGWEDKRLAFLKEHGFL